MILPRIKTKFRFVLAVKTTKFDVTPKEASPSASLPLRVIELMWDAALGIIKLMSVRRHGNYEPHFGVLVPYYN